MFSIEAREALGVEKYVTFRVHFTQNFGEVVIEESASSCYILTPVCGCGSQLTAAVIGGDCPESGF